MLDENKIRELKESLLQEKKSLEENLSKIANPVDTKKGDYEAEYNDLGSDFEDNATEVDEYSSNISVETTLEVQLREVIEALEKIEKGEYGKCVNCGKEISGERLIVNPSAKTCSDCNEKK